MELQKLHLPKKPLVEAIFELRWELRDHPEQPQIKNDPGFKFLVGSYYNAVKDDYPVPVELPVSQVPTDLSPYTVRLQFWAGSKQWPVTQIGPGIMTVNQTTEGYSWSSFKPCLMNCVSALFDSYPALEDFSFTPTWSELRYQNAIPYDQQEGPLLAFLEKKLHTKVTIDHEFFEATGSENEANSIGLNLSFSVSQLPGIVILAFNTAVRENEPVILWTTIVRSWGPNAPPKPADCEGWLEKSHFVARKAFETLSAGQLFDSFGG